MVFFPAAFLPDGLTIFALLDPTVSACEVVEQDRSLFFSEVVDQETETSEAVSDV